MNTEGRNAVKAAIKLLAAHSIEDFVSRADAKEAAQNLDKIELYNSEPAPGSRDEIRFGIVDSILNEVSRGETKHPNWPTDKVYGAGIIGEESGEVMRACVQFEMEGGKLEEVSKELIQTAAVCIRMLMNIEYTEISRHEQH